MNKKLTYTKIADSVIEININNDYVVTAMYLYDVDNGMYNVNFYIREKDVDILDMMRELATSFKTDKLHINSAILKHVATLLFDGRFDRYIQRYDDYILYSEPRV